MNWFCYLSQMIKMDLTLELSHMMITTFYVHSDRYV